MNILESINNCNKNQTAIMMCNGNKIEASLTYSDINNISNDLLENFSNHFKNDTKKMCIGLLMEHNIYLPSIILSLCRLQYPFIFLTNDNIRNTLIDLEIDWVISLKDKLENIEELVAIIDRIELSQQQNKIYLYKCLTTHSSILDFEDIFYVITTSGTTGDKKFVRVQNNCIEDNIRALSQKFSITSSEIIYFGTPLTFDPSMVELLLGLANNATLLITSERCKINTNLLYKTLFPANIEENPGITFMQIVPSLFMRWTTEQINSILHSANLKILAFGGEPFPVSILNFNKTPNLKLFNLYGITEISCWATINEITNINDGEITIGEELGDTLIEVRDENEERVEEGEGEIYIGSKSRICYIGDEEKSNISLPLFRKTGDNAKISNRKIYFSTRKMDIIKRFGHKIHLIKLEKTIMEITGLPNTCVWYEKQSKLLLFLIVSEFNSDIKRKIIDKLRVKLLHSLPKQYFPDFIDILPKFPVTSHGKLDKKCLELYYKEREKMTDSPSNIFKILLCQYFGLNLVQLNELMLKNFFDIGGNSIMALQFLGELSEYLEYENRTELMTFLFENSLNVCVDCLNNYRPKQGKIEVMKPTKSKRMKKGGIQFKVKWTCDLQACVDATPIILEYGNQILVAVGSYSEIFTVINAENGEIISKFKLGGPIESSALFVPPNHLLIGCFNGKMYCLDLTKNCIKWEFQTGDVIKCTPIVCQNSQCAVFGSFDKHIYCIRIEDGSCDWKILVNEAIKANPLYYNTKIYIATFKGTCLCLSEQGEIIWKYKNDSYIFGTPCIIQNHLIIANVLGTLICLNLEGKEKWRFICNGNIFSSLRTVDNDKILFNCHDGNLYVIKFTSSIAEILYRVELGNVSSSTPYFCLKDEKQFVIVTSNNGIVYFIDYTTAELLNQFELPAHVFSSPVFHSNRIYFGCRDNNLYCVDVNFQ